MCGLQRLKAELHLAAVMRGQAQVAVSQRIDMLIHQGLQTQEITGRFRHFAGIDLQEITMHPEIRQTGAVARHVLRDFIAVVNRNMVFAAAVNIKPRCQVFCRHRRAFNMPARETTTPRAIPFHLTLFVFRAEFPQRKIGGIAFFTQFHAAARLDRITLDTCQITVVILLAGIKVNAVAGAVGVTVFLDATDEIDLFCDMVGCFTPDCRFQNIQGAEIVLEGSGEAVCDLPCRFTGFTAAFFHFVFAVIAVRHQMADVGDVNHVTHVVAIPFQRTAQQIFKQIGTQIADVRIVIHGRTAAVQANPVFVKRAERTQAAFPVIVEL